ncbi:hypothetical protein O6H91_05G025800 [Diphasiastrum complanatum]|uniref:Uncharacterized protein n=9 Tax=Diphasiastrum complanatum TaxID=34168 RepID=A0ACC2DMH2_DIPCM|nr:hypothetical protein O6H91_05G025800 [Diphasiastrum complanatum]KAJ7555192.1 hypothetical protein O6H91_05G025800 [Diphasiastrum complanatum]KAJ7555193.1 hypothetical protein O6H91_05G025800 [Diphasiastrum complanatum]KAJ7555194.1 hypothetical protein O6H91_05G025800 [Diphasiastrum complanatum]KAJ7555195.1 hypothetical protein O6H91_05G025800 [Diphasiastrum complanatum]
MAKSTKGVDTPRILVHFKKMNGGSEQSNIDEHEVMQRPVRKKRRTRRYCDSDSSSDDEINFWKAMRRKAWIDYEESDSSSESAIESFELQNDSLSASKVDHTNEVLPVGVVRGCEACESCQKVQARWRPTAGRGPGLADAPVYFPDAEEFSDPIKFIASIRDEAEPFGICRIVPPRSWQPPCPLKDRWKLQENFPTRVQQIHKLQVRESSGKTVCQTIKDELARKRERPVRMGSMYQVNVEAEGPHNEFGFEPGPDFTLESFESYANEFKEHYFRGSESHIDMQCAMSTSACTEPTLEMIEGEYWRIVEEPTEQIEVLYGADIETGSFGSGFPKVKVGTKTQELSGYETSGWNLNNMARGKGSVLAFEEADISGVVVPWLYVGMCFSSFCWHVEDHHFYSVNYMHWGSPKIWYGVPGMAALKLEDAMRKHLPDLFKEQPDLLHKLVTQLSPSVLTKEGVPVYRAVQRPGDFVVTFPRAYHAGFNCGFNCAEAVNVAPIDWLPHGQQAVELYRDLHRKASVSHDKLLLAVSFSAIQELHQFQTASKENVVSSLEFLQFCQSPGVAPLEQASQQSGSKCVWQEFCGQLGMLTDALQVRLKVEHDRRAGLTGIGTIKMMDMNFDATEERECLNCRYDLHLSAVGCDCSPERYACLEHVAFLCTCSWDQKFILIRYELSELDVLLAALKGQPGALCSWVKQQGTGHNKPGAVLKSGPCTKFVAREMDASACPTTKISYLAKLSSDELELITNKTDPSHESSFKYAKEMQNELLSHESEVKLGWLQVNRDSPVETHKVHQESEATRDPQTYNVSIITPSLAERMALNREHRPLRSVETSVRVARVETTFSKPCKQSEHMTSKFLVQSSDYQYSLQQSLPEKDKKQERFPYDLNLTDLEQKNIPNNISQSEGSRLLSNPVASATLKLSDSTQKIGQSFQCNDAGLVEHTCNQKSPSDLIVLSDDEGEDIACANASDSCLETSLCLGKTGWKNLSAGKARTGIYVKEAEHMQNVPCSWIGSSLENPPQSEQIQRLEICASFHEVGIKDDIISLLREHALRLSQESATLNSLTMVGDQIPLLDTRSRGHVLMEDQGHSPLRINGPQTAKVFRSKRINHNIELLDVGALVLKENWHDKYMIYPAGFKSRTSFYNFHNLPERCYYISEILDTGKDRPYFKVTLEGYTSEESISSSVDECWREIQNRLNLEIQQEQNLGRADLADLHPPERLSGCDMFGFSSPSIVQAVEALDPEHFCVHYWAAKKMERPQLQHPSHDCDGGVKISEGTRAKPNHGALPENTIGCPGRPRAEHEAVHAVIQRTTSTSCPDRRKAYNILRELFKKGTHTELWTLLSVFRSDWGGQEWKEGCQALTDEFEHMLESRR